MTTTENEQRDELTQELTDVIAGAVDPDTTVCTRVWEAWSYGTMGPDDFTPLAEDPDSLLSIADAILAAGFRKPNVLGYAVVGRNGRTFGVLYSTSREAQISADEWTAGCLESGIDWEYRVAEIVEATR